MSSPEIVNWELITKSWDMGYRIFSVQIFNRQAARLFAFEKGIGCLLDQHTGKFHFVDGFSATDQLTFHGRYIVIREPQSAYTDVKRKYPTNLPPELIGA